MHERERVGALSGSPAVNAVADPRGSAMVEAMRPAAAEVAPTVVTLDEQLLRRLVSNVVDDAPVKGISKVVESRVSLDVVSAELAITAGCDGVCPDLPVQPERRPTTARKTAATRLKRAIDVAGALTLAAGLSPLLAGCALAVRLGSPGPILFRQKRVGKDGQTFTMLKFRTMYVDADQAVHQDYVKQFIAGTADAHHANGVAVFKLVGDARVTPIGRWLRRLSLDELPQIFNVLRGEMSLVGPRPPLPYEVEHYRPRDLGRLRVKPGITGLWQVSGRGRTTFDQMINLDLEYIERWSIGLDLRILCRTLPVVLFPDGH